MIKESGYVRAPSNQKIDSKGSRAVDFASRFIMIIESANLRPRGLLKVRILMQNQRLANPSNPFFGSKGCERTPTPMIKT
jgi:hypothetical protein